MLKKNILIFVITFSLFIICCTADSIETKSPQIRKQPEIQQVKPKKPVKIKVKRTSEGRYSWDLTGDDVDEIVRADKRLKKLLRVE